MASVNVRCRVRLVRWRWWCVVEPLSILFRWGIISARPMLAALNWAIVSEVVPEPKD